MGTSIPNKKLPINAIKISKCHWDMGIDDADIEDLAECIREHKLINPILVRPVKGKNGVYELLGGERRLRAVKRLGESVIDCRVVKCDDDDEARVLSTVENIKQRDMPAAKRKEGIRMVYEFEKAKIEAEEAKEQARRDQIAKVDPKAARIFSTRGKKAGRPRSKERQAIKRAAEKVGISPSKVDEVVKQGNLVPIAKKALETERITEKQAYKLAGRKKSEQHEMLRKFVAENRDRARTKKAQENLKKKGKAEKYAIQLFEKLNGDAERVYSQIDALDDGLTESTMGAIIDIDRDPLIHLHKKLDGFLSRIEAEETRIAAGR